jgi:hypothetical protein
MRYIWLQYKKNYNINWRGVETNSTLKVHSLGDETNMKLCRLKTLFGRKRETVHLLPLVTELETSLEAYIYSIAISVNAIPGGCHDYKSAIAWELGFLCTVGSDSKQAPHVDYDPSSYQRIQWEKRTRDRNKAHQQSVPYVLEFPLYSEGMEIEIWPWEGDIGAPMMENRHLWSRRIGLEMGQSLLFRGDVVHAGGFKRGRHGNVRVHVNIYPGGIPHKRNYFAVPEPGQPDGGLGRQLSDGYLSSVVVRNSNST